MSAIEALVSRQIAATLAYAVEEHLAALQELDTIEYTIQRTGLAKNNITLTLFFKYPPTLDRVKICVIHEQQGFEVQWTVGHRTAQISNIANLEGVGSQSSLRLVPPLELVHAITRLVCVAAAQPNRIKEEVNG